MTIHGYIDESGTMAKDEVLAIGLVLCSGRNKADRIHFKTAQKLYPEHASKPKIIDAFDMHFCKMSEDFIETSATTLRHEPIRAFVSYRYHDEETTNFAGFMKQYTLMAKQVIYQALITTDEDLEIVLGEMGQKPKYEKALCTEIESVSKLYSHRHQGKFRKVSCTVASAKVKGIQLADFYAGATRRMIMSLERGTERGSSAPFNHLENQIWHDWSW